MYLYIQIILLKSLVTSMLFITWCNHPIISSACSFYNSSQTVFIEKYFIKITKYALILISIVKRIFAGIWVSESMGLFKHFSKYGRLFIYVSLVSRWDLIKIKVCNMEKSWPTSCSVGNCRWGDAYLLQVFIVTCLLLSHYLTYGNVISICN